MALTAEQQAQIEYEFARDSLTREANFKEEMRRVRLDAIRLAKEVLLENARSKPVDARDVSAEDIQAFADVISAYVKG